MRTLSKQMTKQHKETSLKPGRRNDLTEYAAQETCRCRRGPPQVLRDGYINTFLPAGSMGNILGPDEAQAIGFDSRD